MSADAAASTNQPVILAQFTPERYRADGTTTFGGFCQLVGMTGIAGLILGVIASQIAQYFYFVLLFPIAIGLGVGAVGKWCIRRFHIRNPLMCGAAGFVAGVLAMLSMHFSDYRRFESRMEIALGPQGHELRAIASRAEEIKANWDAATPDEQALIGELEQDPDGLRALQVNSVWSFMDMNAHHGVELNSRPGGGGGVNLGYHGSYIYWGIETLIVAGMAYIIMSGAANEPYCSNCSQWKSGTLYGPFANSKQIRQIIQDGELRPFAIDSTAGPLDGLVTIYSCSECDPDGDVDVLVERFTVNGKGETSKKKLAYMTYPAEAFAPLTIACTALAAQAAEEATAREETAVDQPVNEASV